jgi:hypothetical protein
MTSSEEKAETNYSTYDDDSRLKELEAEADAAYDEMYESSHPIGEYARAKEAFYDAIGLAKKMGRMDDVEQLNKRLEHVRDVFMHQFV